MTDTTQVAVLYTDAGGGHRASAQALKSLLEHTGHYRVTLVNPYRDVFPQLDLFQRISGQRGEETYNRYILQDSQTWLACWAFYVAVKLNYALTQRPAVRLLAHYFCETRPDIVVSVMPLGNQVMMRALARMRRQLNDGRRRSAAVVMTDWSELLGGVWFPNRSDYHAICGTQTAYQQASRLAQPAPRVHAIGGLLIRPDFPAARTAPAQRQALGLDPKAPVVTVLYGAQGSVRMRDLALAMAEVPHAAQLVFICGRNTALAEQLRQLRLPYPAQIHGFSDTVPAYLSVSDLFIGKPGPGCVSEALAVGVPMLLDRKRALPQEKSVWQETQAKGQASAFATLSQFKAAFGKALASLDDSAACSDFPINTSGPDILALMETLRPNQRDSAVKAGSESASAALAQNASKAHRDVP